MKLDIENKILIPFMILAILPITILGIVSYWTGYQLLINDRVKNQEALLKEAVAYIETINEDVENKYITLDAGKAKAKRYFQRINEENMIIISGKDYVLNNSKLGLQNLETIFQDGSKHAYTKNNILYIFDKFDKWNWTIIFSIDKSIIVDELLDLQKYTLLLTIIFLVLSMQAIIFIAHHISKPIKYFADVCKRIEIDNLNEKININRGDEIGILSNSFNHMIDQLNISTEKLIEATKFNEDILKNIYIGIMTTDNNGELLSINETGKEIFIKYSNVDIISELNKQIIKTITEERNINTVVEINIQNGQTIYFDVSTSLLKKENGLINGAICSFNDITNRKVLENNLVRVDRLASVGQFAAGLAHEIRNPLTGIKTSIQVIKNREINKNELSSIELFDGVAYEIDRINNLITELLDFSKPKQTNRGKADIVSILKRSLDLTKEGISRKKIKVGLDSEGVHFIVFVDMGQVEQIFINIISNAVDSMEQEGRLNIEIKNIYISSRPFVSIVFEDNGCGMEEENIEKVFDPFFTTKPKGTGLGLSVVSQLVEGNDGKVEIESILNQGTKFKVFLPAYMGDKKDEN